ncbi:unnamed protein product, partial [Ectocarpus sp. 12 AP-2014]
GFCVLGHEGVGEWLYQTPRASPATWQERASVGSCYRKGYRLAVYSCSRRQDQRRSLGLGCFFPQRVLAVLFLLVVGVNACVALITSRRVCALAARESNSIVGVLFFLRTEARAHDSWMFYSSSNRAGCLCGIDAFLLKQ